MEIELLKLPKAKELICDLKVRLDATSFVSKRRHNFLFVCGGPPENNLSLRSKFLNYATSNLSEFKTVLAERSLKTTNNIQKFTFNNIALFEETIAHLSDGIVIFPESPGSYAEVGYFARQDHLAKKILIVNLIHHQEDSFINLGPVDIIDKRSFLAQKIHLPEQNPENGFGIIKSRLERITGQNQRNHRFNLHGRKPFKLVSMQNQLMVALWVIELFPGIALEDFKNLMPELFGFINYHTLEVFLGILESTGLLSITTDTGLTLLRANSASESGLHLSGFDTNNFKLRSYEFLSSTYRLV